MRTKADVMGLCMKVATEAKRMELRAEIDENVGLVGNTSVTFRYPMHIDCVDLLSLTS